MRAGGRSGLNSILNLLPEPVRVRASITSLLGETSIPNKAARANGSYGGPDQPESKARKTVSLTFATSVSTGSDPAAKLNTDRLVHRSFPPSATGSDGMTFTPNDRTRVRPDS